MAHLANHDRREDAAGGDPVDDPRPAAGPSPSLDALVLDAMAVQLTASLAQIVVPLAQTAKRFAKKRDWRNFGYRRVHDFARERLQRSGRWFQQLAQLGRGIERLPELTAAINGSDGAAPVGKVAALEILRVAKRGTVREWIQRARRSSVRDFRVAVEQALDDSPHPMEITREERWAKYYDRKLPEEPEDERPGEPADLGGELPRKSRIGLFVPAAVRVAFDECLDLHRAVVGGHAPVAGFVEALVAECSSGGTDAETSSRKVDVPPGFVLPRADSRSAVRVPYPRTLREDGRASLRDVRAHLGLDRPSQAAVSQSVELLERLGAILQGPPPSNPKDLEERLAELIRIEDDIERRLTDVLVRMDHLSAWRSLGFADAGHYARARLGVSRSTIEERLRVARSLRRLPVLRKAYEKGRIGVEAASLLRRILGRSKPRRDVERAWVEKAVRTTVKRLRDEARAIARRRIREGLATTPMPLPDDAWHASLEQRPGTILRRTAEFGLAANRRPVADSVLSMHLDDDLADAFLVAIEARRRTVAELGRELLWNAPLQDAPDPAGVRRRSRREELPQTPATLVARAFALSGAEVPRWVGLLSMLEEFVAVWDNPKGIPKRKSDAVYSREGWRCMVPGCTERVQLEDHHFKYRSRGGSDDLWNRGCLCAFHHRLGEHGRLLRCFGKAPLGVTWRLGLDYLAEWFRNETRIPPPVISPPGMAHAGA